jgi:predicted nucleotide-binding protein
VLNFLEEKLEYGSELIAFQNSQHAIIFEKWHDEIVEYLKEAFVDNEVADFFLAEAKLGYSLYIGGPSEIYGYELGKARKALRRILGGMSEETHDKSSDVKDRSDLKTHSKKVFIVHGHNKSVLSEVARLLGQLKLEPIILHEQANRGQTIIEKFEEHSDVDFAIVLMTADDKGASNDEAQSGSLKSRARQNVVLELGYFFAKLSRARTCVLKEASVEEPSDILGVVYNEIDTSGAWKFLVAKELKAAGYKIDMNLL